MASNNITGSTSLERLLRRYETTDTMCPECGYVDDEGNWTSETNGRKIVYLHVCPGCDASREHTFDLQ